MRQAAASSPTRKLNAGLSLGVANGSFAHRHVVVVSNEFCPSDATWPLRAAIDQGLIVNLDSWRG
jgi:hypothetical protein